MQIEVEDRPDANRYDVLVDGVQAGSLLYRLSGERITFTHAEVDDSYEGQGVGSALASYALDDARTRGLEVVPSCPFVSGYVTRHPEYVDLVPAELRSRYGLST